MELCKRTKSVLICAKLDRLSRNVAFTSRLLESDVEIVFCDFPKANRLLLHIVSSIAEYEANLISERTRLSLAMKKKRGAVLGKHEKLLNNHTRAIANSVLANRRKALENANNRRASALIVSLRRSEAPILIWRHAQSAGIPYKPGMPVHSYGSVESISRHVSGRQASAV